MPSREHALRQLLEQCIEFDKQMKNLTDSKPTNIAPTCASSFNTGKPLIARIQHFYERLDAISYHEEINMDDVVEEFKELFSDVIYDDDES